MIKVKSWPLLFLSAGFIFLFIKLGLWQLHRADEKIALLASFKQRQLEQPLSANKLLQKKDLRFYIIKLKGYFNNTHSLILDNVTFHGQVGYRIYTPFLADGSKESMLVDRGFIPLGQTRQILPKIQTISNKVQIRGLLSPPPTFYSHGGIEEKAGAPWPKRIEYLNLSKLSTLLSTPISPYIVVLAPNDPLGYALEWNIVVMPPEKHQGYAVQWFAFAGTLLLLSLGLNFRLYTK